MKVHQLRGVVDPELARAPMHGGRRSVVEDEEDTNVENDFPMRRVMPQDSTRAFKGHTQAYMMWNI